MMVHPWNQCCIRRFLTVLSAGGQEPLVDQFTVELGAGFEAEVALEVFFFTLIYLLSWIDLT